MSVVPATMEAARGAYFSGIAATQWLVHSCSLMREEGRERHVRGGQAEAHDS